MKLYLFLSSLLLVVFLLFPPKALAVAVTITSYPTLITSEPFTLTASISGATTGTNYLRVDIYKDGTQNYFGETYNGSDWYSASDYHQYLPITIQSGSWTGQVQARLGIPATSQYDGLGIYKVRIRRYTSGGGYTASEADASSVIIQIITPTPTPTPTDIPTTTPYPTPTNSPTPTSQLTATNTPKPSPSLFLPHATEGFATQSPEASLSADVLREETTISPTTVVEGVSTVDRRVNWVAVGLVSVGGLILLICGILFFYKRKRLESNGTDSNE